VLPPSSSILRRVVSEVDRRFRGAYCLNYQIHYRSGDGGYAPQKRRSNSKRLHGATFQKAVIFIYNAAINGRTGIQRRSEDQNPKQR
jgi:hypothetical protein